MSAPDASTPAASPAVQPAMSAQPVPGPQPAINTNDFGHEHPHSSVFLPLRWLFGLLSFALKSGSELTRLVAEMHHTIAQAPLPFARDVDADIRRAPRTYRLIRALLEFGADKVQNLIEVLPDAGHPPATLRRFRSAINGVMGDKLRDWQHPLALDLSVVDAEGQPVVLAELQRRHAKGVVLFIHGLCLSEWDWQSPAHQAFVDELQAQGYGVAWICYNSGLPIWENGAALAQLLEWDWQAGDNDNCDNQCDNQSSDTPFGNAPSGNRQPLLLIGHSMGGLLIRSAVHYQQQQAQPGWLQSLTHAAYLAAPHAGAPLEKIGNFANSLLGVSPYSKPLMALGNIRSLGIRSLRHGNVTPPVDATEQQYPLPFNPQFRHLLLAARMGDDPAKRWLGDGLVPVQSALGEGHFPEQHPQIERTFIDHMGHIRLLHDERTYAALRDWLNGPVLN